MERVQPDEGVFLEMTVSARLAALEQNQKSLEGENAALRDAVRQHVQLRDDGMSNGTEQRRDDIMSNGTGGSRESVKVTARDTGESALEARISAQIRDVTRQLTKRQDALQADMILLASAVRTQLEDMQISVDEHTAWLNSPLQQLQQPLQSYTGHNASQMHEPGFEEGWDLSVLRGNREYSISMDTHTNGSQTRAPAPLRTAGASPSS